jgi:ATP-dependent RNA helicase RhlB
LFKRQGPDLPPLVDSSGTPIPQEKKREHPKKGSGPDARGNRDNRRKEVTRDADQHTNRAPKWNRDAFVVPEEEGKTRFHDLDLPDSILHAIADAGFSYCTPIQAEVLPATLKGQDAFGRAQTGTGKTAAFLITVLTRMVNAPRKGNPSTGRPRVLIIAPTRELVLQIADEAKLLATYCHFSIVSVFGGMDYEKQRRQLTGKTVDVVVATPGRLLDFKRRKDLDLSKVEMLIIDEADRMLDMGFIPDVRQIVYSTPHKDKRQTLFFSATLTPDVTRLSGSWTRNPVNVEIEPEQVAVDTVEQVVYIVTSDEKFALTYNIIIQKKLDRVLIFCNRRDETRRLADILDRYRIDCAVLSGEIPQKKRIRTLDLFKNGKIRVLVATDVAGRGIHIEGMDYVINFTLPHDPEDYVHRIGRTGRAGAAGTSISFACEEDSFYIPAIEDYIGRPLHCVPPDEEWLDVPPPPPRRRKPKPAEGGEAAGAKKGNRRRRRRPSSGGNRPPRRQSNRPARSRGDRPRRKTP